MTLRHRIGDILFDRSPAALAHLRPVPGYCAAILAAFVALAVRHSLDGVLPPGFPYLTFFPAVILTAFVAGLGPGVLCAVLSGGAAWYFYLDPVNSFHVTPPTLLAILFFVFVAGIDIALVHVTQVGGRRLRDKRALTARLYADQKTIFAELQHRVANNLAFVSSLLQLERRRVADNPAEAVAVIDEAAARIATVGRIHRRLYDPAAVDRPIGRHLQDVCDELLTSSGAATLRCQVDAADVRISLDRLVPLSLLVTELVTNCIKHAFPDRDAGIVAVTLQPEAPGRLSLTVRDDGVGMIEKPGDTGLGTRIVRGLAAQLDGTLTMRRDNGTVARVDFPAR